MCLELKTNVKSAYVLNELKVCAAKMFPAQHLPGTPCVFWGLSCMGLLVGGGRKQDQHSPRVHGARGLEEELDSKNHAA